MADAATVQAQQRDTIGQLESARTLALEDASYYQQIVPGVLPIVGARAGLPLRQWGAGFLSETLASPRLPAAEKEQLSRVVLPTLRDYLDSPAEHPTVVKSAVQAVTSAYPFVFLRCLQNTSDPSLWQTMAHVKASILQRFDTAPSSIRICCVKFIERVVQCQTPGLTADPRRPDWKDVSISLVPRDHPFIAHSMLEAEALGFLDRLLSFLGNVQSDVLCVAATLNSLGFLIQSRASVANKIIIAILQLDPYRRFEPPLTYATMIQMKALEKTLKAIITNVLKRNPQHALAARIHQHFAQLQRTRTMIPDKGSGSAALSDSKSNINTTTTSNPLMAPQSNRNVPDIESEMQRRPISFAELFTLTDDEGFRSFDVQGVPLEVIAKIVVSMLTSLDAVTMQTAIETVRARYARLHALNAAASHDNRARVALADSTADEDEDYEPEYAPDDDGGGVKVMTEPGLGQMDHLSRPGMAFGGFIFPTITPLSPVQLFKANKANIDRLFHLMQECDNRGAVKTSIQGFSRQNNLNHNRDLWASILIRLATRGSPISPATSDRPAKREGQQGEYVAAQYIRQNLYTYVLENFRRRLDIAIMWLYDEWFCEEKAKTISQPDAEMGNGPSSYSKWTLLLLDGLLPYIDRKDKLIIRFLSEIPVLKDEFLTRVAKLANDPELSDLAINTLLYLILFRPPCREACLDILEDILKKVQHVKPSVRKVIAKWRSTVV